MYDVLFTDEGSYRLSVLDKSKTLATTEATLFYAAEDYASPAARLK